MPTFIKTGYWDKLSKAPKGYLNLDSLSSQNAISISKAELDIHIANNTLIPGAMYEISGVDVNLYGGTTIFIEAATTNKLNLQGHGVFYNPKYINTQATPNNGYGIWQSANTYAIGDDAIWGGKHWTNKTGVAGSSVDRYTLDSTNWEVVPFDATNYNMVADIIHYDQSHDMIIRRVDKWNNDVSGNYLLFSYIPTYLYNAGNPIKDFQWGNGPEDFNNIDGNQIGVYSNYVQDSYLDCINFIGNNCSFNKLTQLSSIDNNTVDTTSWIRYNSIVNGSISNNILSNTSHISYNTLNFGGIVDNTLSDNSSIFFNSSVTYMHIDVNVLTNGSNIQFNTINGTITYVTLSTSNITNNILQNSVWTLAGSGTLTSKTISKINAVDAVLNANISAASIIYGNYSKTLFLNSAGVARLSYYNASNVLTVVAPNA